MNRRQFLAGAAAAGVLPSIAAWPCTAAQAAPPPNIQFLASHRGKPSGEHNVIFRTDGTRLSVATHIDITIKVLFFAAFRLKHDAEEIWQSGRLVSVKSTTNDDGVMLNVSGYATAEGFRIFGTDGPFLASADLLTSNTLWDSRLVRESRLIDVQNGGEVGMVAKRLGDDFVETVRGRISASHHKIITPHYAGEIFYDSDGRWVKGLIERQGEILEYALAN